MRPNPSFRNFCRRRPGWSDDWIYQRPEDAKGQEFGDVTSLVNALRNRRLYQFSSVRLLADLVEVMRGLEPQRPIRPQPADASDVLAADWLLMRRAAAASPCLFRSLQLEDQGARPLARRQVVHRILLCEHPRLNAPVAGLAHVLAAAIARQFDEAAAAVVLDGGRAWARLWFKKTEIPVRRSARTYDELVRTLAAAMPTRARRGGRPPLLHIVSAAPAHARDIPEPLARPPGFEVDGGAVAAELTAGYDRIIYLTDSIPHRAPAEWVNLLTTSARWRDPARADRHGPYFCSFIPTLLGDAVPTDRTFDSESVDQEFALKRPGQVREQGWRLARDHCRATFPDLDALGGTWTAAGGSGSPAARAPRPLPDDADTHAVADRWARAVTNRRIGVALSGGGASSYRLVPILEGLHENQVPVDVVSGVSGGALLAAYYCHGGIAGLQRCIELGKRIDLRMLGRAFVFRDTFEALVDEDLGDVDVRSLGTRLVALATAMFADLPPAPHVVTAGTLGAAVQVSGAAPVLFSATVKRVGNREVRFADGATSAFIPARILRDCGADLVFAFNCLAGPENRNPLGDWGTPGHLLQALPIADRLIDLWISGSYLAQRIGRETDEDAQVYFEPDDEEQPLLESFWFTSGQAIADTSRRSPKVKRCIEDCAAAWRQFRSWT